jgi:sterol desaturase/sphingolipid hydroxylase (fatty acid hydroxylase superfamily)
MEQRVAVAAVSEPRSLRRVQGSTLIVLGLGALLCLPGVLALGNARSLISAVGATGEELIGIPVLVFVGLVILLERIRPAVRRPLLARGQVHDALYLLVYVLIAIPLITVLGIGVSTTIHHVAPNLVLPRFGLSPWIEVPLGLVVTDACNWLAHWCNHQVRSLWRLHAVHHTQEELSILTSFRAHPLVHVSFFLCALPVFVLASNAAVPTLVLSMYICLGALPHANVSWNYGPLGRIIVSPAYHRLHHSLDGPNGVNLGVVLTLWDRLARRAVFPEADKGPVATGLATHHIPLEQHGRSYLGTLVAQLGEPLRVHPPASPASEPALPKTAVANLRLGRAA